MLRFRARLTPFLFAAICAAAPAVHAQANTTAGRRLDLSVFAGATGTYTGLDNGKNLSFTAGLDVGPAREWFGLQFAAEGRGTYDLHDGSVGGERSALGGVRIQKPLNWLDGRFTPSVDVLAGRGQFDFVDPGRVNRQGTLLYHQYAGNVLSPGAGFLFDLTPSFAFHADAQFQRWDTFAVTGTHPHSIPTTFGVTYRFGRRQRSITEVRR